MKTLKDMVDTLAYDDEQKKDFNVKLGQRVSEERQKHKIKSGKFAALCGISESCLFNLEKGQTNISITNLLSICLVLDITLDELIPPDLYQPNNP